MAKPADFYVGVVDIFSILLPGAVVSWTAWVWLDGQGTVRKLVPEGDLAPWVTFLLASYAAGHLVFMLASLVDVSYDGFRKRVLLYTLGSYRRRVEGNALRAARALRTVSLGISSEPNEKPDPLQPWARYVLEKSDNAPTVPEPINAYQWSRAVLRLLAPTALAEVTRIEADSKFFRSLFVVFALLAICSIAHISGYERLPVSGNVMLVLAALSYWRYAEQRNKATVEAYRAVLVLFSMRGKATPPPTAKVAGEDE
jgi:hypothetical protein